MAKSKYAPALFEVIGKKDEKALGLPLPKWWRRKEAPASPVPPGQSPTPDPAAAPEANAGEAAQTPPAQSQGNGVSPAAVRTTAETASTSPLGTVATSPARQERPCRTAPLSTALSGREEDEDRPPVARIRNGRVELSLNPVNAAIVGGILLLTLFLTYQVGRGFSPAGRNDAQAGKPDSTLEEAKNKQADPSVLAVGPGSGQGDRSGNRSATPGSGSSPKNRSNPPPTPPAGPPAGPTAAGTVQRVPGLTYVVLETFKREDQAEAEQIRQWLKTKHNLDTTIEASGEKWQLVSTQGFDYGKDSDKRACGEYVAMVKTWGKEYKAEFKSNARYDMRDPGFKLYRARQ